MRLELDESRCTGHGRCYALAPDVFGADDYGHCEILVADGLVPEELFDPARLGVANCPERALTLVEERARDRGRRP